MYYISLFLLLFFLVGCDNSLDALNEVSGSPIVYEGQQRTMSKDQKQRLAAIIKDKQDKGMALTVNVPHSIQQSASFERALWQVRANHLEQYLRMQGFSANQIHFKECEPCSTITVA
tara:strand:- start:140 stop:490 length:351 start_codon:yes stop_codon:yes gene_type:complete